MNVMSPTNDAHISTPLSVGVDSVPQPAAQQLNDSHPLEKRLRSLRTSEEAFKMQLLQRSQGSAEPIRRKMEMEIIERSTFVPGIVGGPSNVHLDILKNHDTSIDWDDVYRDDQRFDFQQELQKRMGL